MKRWWARKHKTNAEASRRSLSEYRLSAKIEENIAMFKNFLTQFGADIFGLGKTRARACPIYDGRSGRTKFS
ncbi:MAG: hypothetical protein ACOYU3_05445 [Bacillota bacterium]